MLDALEADLPMLVESNPGICVELGSGSGVIITAVAKSLPNTACIAIDINSRACTATQQTAKVNGANLDVINMDLLHGFRERCVDVLIFNPPYVVTPDEELNANVPDGEINKNIIQAWAGGTDGRIIIDQLLKRIDSILSSNGIAYIIVIAENKPQEIIANLKAIHFSAKIMIERRIRGEHLFILKIKRL